MIDYSIKDFQPVKRLWPVGQRLALWILLEAIILGLGAGLRGFDGLWSVHTADDFAGIALLLLSGIIAGHLALRTAIPGREVGSWYLLFAAAVLCTTCAAVTLETGIVAPPGQLINLASICALGALPWVALFWAVRRGVPSHPAKTGGLVGLAAFCFALAEHRLLMPGAFQAPLLQLLGGGIITVASACAGAVWLDAIRRWRRERQLPEVHDDGWLALGARGLLPLASGISIAVLLLALWGVRQSSARIPDFDLAIEKYQQSLKGFHPNVPSDSVQAVLTAYIEYGMPSYMWDFGPQGFKLSGGRLEQLPDGTPVTYTWFGSAKGGVMCMFKQTDGFNPPPVPHVKHDGLLFYKYRGFSICLINVGGYGNFISVIAAPMPIQEFTRLVTAVAG